MEVLKTEILRLGWMGENGGYSRTISSIEGYLAFGGLVWTVENAVKRLVWTKNVLSVFKKQKSEILKNVLM